YIGRDWAAHKYEHEQNLLDKTRGEANALIDEKGLRKDKITEDFSNNFKEGEVMKVSPKVGTRVKEMTKVDLVISKGIETFTVEDYIGKSSEEIKEKLEKSGFDSVRIKEEYDSATEGSIINQ